MRAKAEHPQSTKAVVSNFRLLSRDSDPESRNWSGCGVSDERVIISGLSDWQTSSRFPISSVHLGRD